MNSFADIYDSSKHLIEMAMSRLGIRYERDYYRQVGRIALWKASLKYSGKPDEFHAYAYVFIRNILLNEIKMMSKVENRMMVTDSDSYLEFLINNEEQESLDDVRDYVEAILQPLSVEDREMLIALYVHGYTYSQVAKALGISEHALKKRRDRLIKQIRARSYLLDAKQDEK